MGKRKARSQTGSLTSDHLKSGIDQLPMSDSGVRYVVGKIWTRVTTSVETSLRSEIRARRYDLSKSRESRTGTLGRISGLQLGSPGKKSHLDVASAKRRRVYYMGDGGGIPRVRAVVSLMV
jgi:hypothetical protein